MTPISYHVCDEPFKFIVFFDGPMTLCRIKSTYQERLRNGNVAYFDQSRLEYFCPSLQTLCVISSRNLICNGLNENITFRTTMTNKTLRLPSSFVHHSSQPLDAMLHPVKRPR